MLCTKYPKLLKGLACLLLVCFSGCVVPKTKHGLIEDAENNTLTNSLGMTFKLIPAGTFMMGSPSDEPGRISDETRHQVTLTRPFYIQTTEVTQRRHDGSAMRP